MRVLLAVLFLISFAIGCGGNDPQALIKDLGHRDAKIRAKAAFKLAELGPDALVAVPALINALDDENIDVVIWAMHALGEIGPGAKDAVPVLQKKLNAQNWNIRNLAKFALEKIGEHSVSAIIEKLADDNREARKEAADLLIKIGKPAIPGLRIGAVEHKDYRARYWCAHALGELDLDSPETKTIMEKLFQDKTSAVKEKAAEILERIKEKDKK